MPFRHMLLFSVRLLALASLASVMACPLLTKATEPASAVVSTPSALIVVQGNAQTAQAGRPLTTPIVLRVVDANGKGMPKVPATIVVVLGGGMVDPATAISDSSGEMKVRWTLGTASSSQALSVTAGGTTLTTVVATALFPTDIVVAQGGLQTGKISTALKNDIVVRVIGANNTPMAGVTVTFKVTEGGGGITPQSATTGAQGEITGKWTLGTVAGSNTVVASALALAPAVIRATAIP